MFKGLSLHWPKSACGVGAKFFLFLIWHVHFNQSQWSCKKFSLTQKKSLKKKIMKERVISIWLDQMRHRKTHSRMLIQIQSRCTSATADLWGSKSSEGGRISSYIHTWNFAGCLFSRPLAILLAHALLRSFESVVVVTGEPHCRSLQIWGPLLLTFSRRRQPSAGYHCPTQQ